MPTNAPPLSLARPRGANNTGLVLKGLRILAVAAAPSKVTGLTNLLAPARSQIADVSSGAVALELCPQFEPDLTLLAVGLPDPNVFKFCAR